MTEQHNIIRESKELFKVPPVFAIGVMKEEQLPLNRLPEIAFAGRSNVGKSSLINALTGVKDLARVSSTPGRTQQINFFTVQNKFNLVDLPGYGYAKAPKEIVNVWNDLIIRYLKGRAQLKKVFLLIDSRHGIKTTDLEIMKLLDNAAVLYQIILTKTDKISFKEMEEIKQTTFTLSQKHTACYPKLLATSSEKKEGLEEVKQEIVKTLKGE